MREAVSQMGMAAAVTENGIRRKVTVSLDICHA